MLFSIGDQVGFLNEKGGGVISFIHNKNFVDVSVEEGFDLRIHVSELVLVSKVKSPIAPMAESDFTEVDLASFESPAEAVIVGEMGVFFVFIPMDSSLDLSEFRVYIANNTPCRVLFSYQLRMNNRDEGKSSGSLEPCSYSFLQNAHKKDIERWESILMRMIFHKDGVSSHTGMLEHRFSIKPQILSMVHIKKMPLMGQLCIPILMAVPPNDKAVISEAKIPFASKRKLESKDEIPAGARHLRLDTYTNHVEIDLHIEELMDDFSGLGNAEIIRIQKQKFQLALEHAMAKNMKKIYVIHGVGNGTLKREIRRMMDDYSEVTYSDAPSRHYGAGATEVVIK